MRRLFKHGLGLLGLLLCAVQGAAHAAAPSLRCAWQPAHPVLGYPLRWSIEAANLPGIALFRPTRLGAHWLLQRQTSERSAGGPGRSMQTLNVTLYPMAAGALPLPAVRAGGLECAPRAVRVAASAPGQAPQFIAMRIAPPRPIVGQAVRVDLEVGAGGALDWQAVRVHSDDGLLRPVSTVSTRVAHGGARRAVQSVQWQTWSYTPLRAGTATIRAGLLRATLFGKLLIYPVAPLRVRVRPRPAYWPDDAAVGNARWRVARAPSRLELGATGVLRATLCGVQIGRAALLRLLGQAQPTGRGLRVDAARVSLDAAAAHAVTPIWRIELAVRARAGGRLAYPQVRIPYYDPRRGAPELAVADWGDVRVHDPRPLRLFEACGAIGCLVLLLAVWFKSRRAATPRRA